jgi:hypothetical protein
MNRRTLDITIPLLYALAVVIAIVMHDPQVVGGVALIGAVGVAVYYAELRSTLRR